MPHYTRRNTPRMYTIDTHRRHVLIICVLRKDMVPAHLPLQHPAISSPNLQPKPFSREIVWGKIDCASVCETLSVCKINLVPHSTGNELRMFLHLDTDPRRGFNYWQPYEQLVRNMFDRAWSRCRIRLSEHDAVVHLSGARAEKQDAMHIVFRE